MITIEMTIRFPQIKRVNIFGKEDQSVTFIYLGFISIGLWNGNAKSTLLEAIDKLSHDQEWIFNNWPIVRQAKKKAYAKGRAQGIAHQMNWKEMALERGSEVSALQVKNNELIHAINTLRKLDIAP